MDGSFADDRARGFGLGRRAALGLLGAAALRPGAALAACLPTAAETAGPFPADGTNRVRGGPANVLAEAGVERTDLRQSFGGLSAVAEGVPLDLDLTLVGPDCAPLPGHAVYLWHCDAQGRYSIYGLPEANYLRGLQVADTQGRLRFRTILPGCYPGRSPHLHLEVFASRQAAVDGRAARLTSQLAFHDRDCAPVYAGEPRYAGSAAALVRTPLARDGVFRDNPAAVLAAMTVAIARRPQGLRGSATVTLG